MANRYERYDPETKAKFLAAAFDSRKAGNTFEQAYQAAKEAGYKGTVGGLTQAMRQAGMKAKKNKRMAAKAAKAEQPAVVESAAKSMNGMESIEATIANVVKTRVNAAIQQAIDALEALKG